MIVMFGLAYSGVILFIYGPSELLNFPNELYLVIIGLSLLGAGFTLSLIPTLPEMIVSVEGRFDNSRGELNDVASGVFNTCLGVGQIVGPLYSSIVTSAVGFRLCCDMLAIFLIAFSVVYFIFGDGFGGVKTMFTWQPTPILEEPIIEDVIEGDMSDEQSFNQSHGNLPIPKI